MTKPTEIPDLESRFTYHPPKPGQSAQYTRIRDSAKRFAELLADECPPGSEHAIALSKLEECVFWANAAIARHGEAACPSAVTRELVFADVQPPSEPA